MMYEMNNEQSLVSPLPLKQGKNTNIRKGWAVESLLA